MVTVDHLRLVPSRWSRPTASVILLANCLLLLSTEKRVHVFLSCWGRPLVQIIEHLFVVRLLLALRFLSWDHLLGWIWPHSLFFLSAKNYISRVLLAQSTCLGERPRTRLGSTDLKRAVVHHELIVHAAIDHCRIVVLDCWSTLVKLIIVNENRVLNACATNMTLFAHTIHVIGTIWEFRGRKRLSWAVRRLSRVSCHSFSCLLERLEVVGTDNLLLIAAV